VSGRRRIAALALALLLAGAPAAGESALGRPERIPSAREVIQRAFENFYQCDLSQGVSFIVRQAGEVVLQYETRMLRKFIDGRANDLFYFTEGDYRDLKILRIEREDRADDAFVYLPELRRPRRYPTAQRGDKFLGLELTIEDLEIRRIEKYEVVGRSFDRIDGELAYVVTVQPLYDSGYDRADFFVAAQDDAILQIRYYRRGALEPYKLAHAKREWMQHYGGRVLPRRMDFVDRSLGTETTILFRDRRVNPAISQARFSTLSLEKRFQLGHLGGGGEDGSE
jgi:hypothetical protein